MLAEAFPRLAVRLRSTFPDARISVSSDSMRVSFPAFPAWKVEVKASPCHEQFQVIQSKITLTYDCLRNIPETDFYRLLAAENLGLRGVSLIPDFAPNDWSQHAIGICTSFVGQKGRTRDEAENLAIDTLSLLRFARLLEDRILRSVGGMKFSYDLYYTQYLAGQIGRNRYINYARSIFQGSTERLFGQVVNMLSEDYKYSVTLSTPYVATLASPDHELTMNLRVPDGIPMLTLSCALKVAPWDANKSFALIAQLNAKLLMGHFEVNADGSLISYVTWKHLTNDFRYYGLDQMINSVLHAKQLLFSEWPSQEPALAPEALREMASSLCAYKIAA